MGKKSKKKPRWLGNKTYCQNKYCPNGNEIGVAIFKGTGSCSENCLRAQGVKRDFIVTQMGLTADEVKHIEKLRSFRSVSGG